MLKNLCLLVPLLLVSVPSAAEPLFAVGAAKGRLAEACASILSNGEVQEAFAAVSAAADAASRVQWTDLPLQPLKRALQVASRPIASPDLVLLVDIHHCKRSIAADGKLVTLCPGSANLLNTGLSNYQPDDTDRDLARWHSVSAFAGISISSPKAADDPAAPRSRTQLQCRAVEP